MKNQNLISIGRLSKITGVHVKSLRYYDEIGILPPAYVDPDTSYRYYTFQQARVVEVIQFCVELGIPLKRFPEFLEEGTQRIQFFRLIEEGTALAEEKIKSIEEKLILFSEMEKDIERSELLAEKETPQWFLLPKKDCWIEPYEGPQEGHAFHEAANALFENLLERSIEPGYEMGKLLFFTGEEWKSFLFIDVDVSKEQRKKNTNIIHLPASKYLCTVPPTQSFNEDAPEFFAPFFPDLSNRILLEIEMFSGIYDTEDPNFEWCCSQHMRILMPKSLIEP